MSEDARKARAEKEVLSRAIKIMACSHKQRQMVHFFLSYQLNNHFNNLHLPSLVVFKISEGDTFVLFVLTNQAHLVLNLPDSPQELEVHFLTPKAKRGSGSSTGNSGKSSWILKRGPVFWGHRNPSMWFKAQGI